MDKYQNKKAGYLYMKIKEHLSTIFNYAKNVRKFMFFY